jgi:alpha-amylase
MMYVHLLVNQIRGDKYRKKTAREELWKGQFHRAYWHDRNGGIYLNSLRKEIYHAFIEAEKMTRSRGGFIPSIVSFDFDMDGKKEYLYQGRDLNAYVHSLGGMIFELDFLPNMWNYEDTLCRRPEAYHDGAEGIYDWYLRRTFIDHFFSEGDSPESFSNMSFKELGDFVDGGYELQKLDRDHLELVLQRTGTVSLVGKSFPLKIEKGYRFRKAVISVDYTVTNLSQEQLSLWFGNELNLSFASDEKKDLTITKTDCEDKKSGVERGVKVSSNVKMLLLQDLANKARIEFQTENGCSLWSLPIETISRSCSTNTKRYQSTCLVPNWHLTLEPEGQWRNSLRLGFSKGDTRK